MTFSYFLEPASEWAPYASALYMRPSEAVGLNLAAGRNLQIYYGLPVTKAIKRETIVQDLSDRPQIIG